MLLSMRRCIADVIMLRCNVIAERYLLPSEVGVMRLIAGVVARNEHLFDLPNALRAIIWMRRIHRAGSAASTRMPRIHPG
jgi:hypothetical protein